MTSRFSHILRGLIAAGLNWLLKVTIPVLIFSSMTQVNLFGIVIYSEEKLAIVSYWIYSIGILTTAIQFWVSSSPKYSVRKAIAEIFLLFANLFYTYVYSFSAALDFEDISISISSSVSTSFSLDLTNLIYMSMGLTGLNIIVYLYDLVLAIFFPIPDESPEKDRKKKHSKHKKTKKTKSSKKLEYHSVFNYSPNPKE